MARRSGRASSALTALVLETYGRVCHLQLPGCTLVATTKDHLIPYSHGGTDDLENLRPACRHCNSKRQDKVLRGYGAQVIVVIGPPAAGKSTLVRDRADPTDVVIDLDAIARALMPVPAQLTHYYPDHIRHVAIGARQAAIDRAVSLPRRVTVWLIHAVPRPQQLAEYTRLGYRILPVDPGRGVVEQRVRTSRPQSVGPAVQRWYEDLLPHLPTLGVPITAEPAQTTEPKPATTETTNTELTAAQMIASRWLPTSQSV